MKGVSSAPSSPVEPGPADRTPAFDGPDAYAGAPAPAPQDQVEPVRQSGLSQAPEGAEVPEAADVPVAPNNKPFIATVVGALSMMAGLVIPVIGIGGGVAAILVSRSPRNPLGGRNRRRGLSKVAFVLGVIAIVLSVLVVMSRITALPQGA